MSIVVGTNCRKHPYEFFQYPMNSKSASGISLENDETSVLI